MKVEVMLLLVPAILACMYSNSATELPSWHKPLPEFAKRNLLADARNLLADANKPNSKVARKLQEKDTECEDDPQSYLVAAGTNCDGIVELGCDFDLHELNPEAPVGFKVKYICPSTCNACGYWAKNTPIMDDGNTAQSIGRLNSYDWSIVKITAELSVRHGRDMCYFSMQPLPPPPDGYNPATRLCHDKKCVWDINAFKGADLEKFKATLTETVSLGYMSVDRFNKHIKGVTAFGAFMGMGSNIWPYMCNNKLNTTADQCSSEPFSNQDRSLTSYWPTSSIVLRIVPDNVDQVEALMNLWRTSSSEHFPIMSSDLVRKDYYGASGGGLSYKIMPCDIIPDNLKNEGLLADNKKRGYAAVYNDAFSFWNSACMAYYDPILSPKGDYSKCAASVQAQSVQLALEFENKVGVKCNTDADCGTGERCPTSSTGSARRLMFGGSTMTVNSKKCVADCASDEANLCFTSGCVACVPCINSDDDACQYCSPCTRCLKFQSCSFYQNCASGDALMYSTTCTKSLALIRSAEINAQCEAHANKFSQCLPTCSNTIAAKLTQTCQLVCAKCRPCIGYTGTDGQCDACEPCTNCLVFTDCTEPGFMRSVYDAIAAPAASSLCVDDVGGALAGAGMTCAAILPLGCNTDLNSVNPQAPVGSLVKVVCPVSCQACP